ncbi:MAG TPA: tetratricopeptide repeat protein [Hyphomicrobiaceae bacterium]|nr:tetratricopeptide repeat protein [Hyphomicrobiaceae bacterium]
MTSYDPFDPRLRPQPPPEQRPGGGACNADSLRQTLHEIAGQIGDADRRHSDALRDMQGRLARLSGQFEQARGDFAGARRGSARHPEPDPLQVWDAQAAEALTRLYESGDGDARLWPEGRPRPRIRPAAASATEGAPPSQSAAAAPLARADRAWLEQQLGDVTRRLQQALNDIDLTHSLSALAERIDRFEHRLDATIEESATRADLDRLKAIEAHVSELAARADHSEELLARLSTIDVHIGELAECLNEVRDRPPPAPAGLSEEGARALAAAAAERASAQVVASIPTALPRDTETSRRLEGLETLLNDYVAERRHSEEQTAGVLQAIEEALAHIGDRVDALEAPVPAPLPAETAGYTDPFLNGDPLAAAYAEGRRALAPRLYGQTLDASDYVANPVTAAAEPQPALAMPTAEQRAPAAVPPPDAGEGWSSDEFSAAAIRERLRAQAQIPATPDAAPPAVPTDAARRRPRRAPKANSARVENARLGLLIAVGVALLVCAGYLIFDAISGRQSEQRGAKLMHQSSLPQTTRASAFTVIPLVEAAGVARAHAAEAEPPPRLLAAAAPPRTTGALGSAQPQGIPHDSELIALAGPLAAALSARNPPGAANGTTSGLPPIIAPASLRQAAEKGDPAAAFQIGARFAEGRVVPQDFASAFAWYRRAAQKGHTEAQYRLAVLYEHGAGVAADARQAKYWYERAATHGHVTSMHNLAVLEAGPSAGAPDHAAAVRWFKEAAARGLADSQFNLGVLYEKGAPGVSKDAREAFKWFALAARSGDKEAARRLERVAAHLPAATVADLEEKVAAWQQMGSGDAKVSDCPGCG